MYKNYFLLQTVFYSKMSLFVSDKQTNVDKEAKIEKKALAIVAKSVMPLSVIIRWILTSRATEKEREKTKEKIA